MNGKHYGKLEFQYLDPSKDKEAADSARKFNFTNLKWPSLSDGKIDAGEGMIGLVLEQGEKSVVVPFIRS